MTSLVNVLGDGDVDETASRRFPSVAVALNVHADGHDHVSEVLCAA